MKISSTNNDIYLKTIINAYLNTIINIIDNKIGMWIGQNIIIHLITLHTVDRIRTSVDIRQVLTV